ncbi:MAG: S-layer homology domain-containing protein [Eubacterium sp.]|nr:S-layer homology domain-containing protein [Eubacterium sp.]
MKKRFAVVALAGAMAVSSFAAFAAAPESPYSDVETGIGVGYSATFLNKEGFMYGFANNLFKVDKDVTRAQVIMTLYRLQNEPEYDAGQVTNFSDVTEDAGYYDAVEWGSANGIVSGFSNGTFKPKNTVTREQLSMYIQRYVKKFGQYQAPTISIDDYKDAADISANAKEAMTWAVENMILAGDKNSVDKSVVSLGPTKNTDRGQYAIILARLVTAVGAPASVNVTVGDYVDINAQVNIDYPNLYDGYEMISPEEDLGADGYGFIFRSEDESIATVDKTGRVTGVAAGETNIIVRSKLSYEYTKVAVKVTATYTKLDYILPDRQDETVVLDRTLSWESTKKVIDNIESLAAKYTKYNGVRFSFVASQTDDIDRTYTAYVDAESKKVVIIDQNGDDATQQFYNDESKTFSKLTVTFGNGYTIDKLLQTLADVSMIDGETFDGEYTYGDSTISNVSVKGDIIKATIDGDDYEFFHDGKNVFALGDVTEKAAIKKWVENGVIDAVHPALPQVEPDSTGNLPD